MNPVIATNLLDARARSGQLCRMETDGTASKRFFLGIICARIRIDSIA